jgi:hypothetical protein
LGCRFRRAPSLSGLGTAIADFFGEVPGALKNHLTASELFRIAVMALAAGGGMFGALQAVVVYVGPIFPAPADAGLASAVLTLILEVLRRLGHAQKNVVPQG